MTENRATRQTEQPLQDWRLNGASSRAARGIVDTMLDQMDVSPSYQRGDVWSMDQRIALVKSWLMGVPIPALVLNNRDNPEWAATEGPVYGDGVHAETFRPIWALVDGKQRLETARLWFAGALAVPASWFDPEWIKYPCVTEDGPYVTHEGLTLTARRHIGHQFMFPVIEAKLPSLRAEAELYLLVNGGGTAQTEADMSNAARVAAERK